MTVRNANRSNALTHFAAAIFAVGMTFAAVSASKAQAEEGFRAKVESNIDQEMRLPNGVGRERDREGTAIVVLTIAADGTVRSAALAQSAGFSAFDREALRTASKVSYPATGEERTVAMALGFNQKVTPGAQRKAVRLAEDYRAKHDVMLANSTTAQQPES